MSVKLAPPPEVVGWIVCGGSRPGGGPAYMLLAPEGRLFPTAEDAKARAREIAETPDWWLIPMVAA